MGHSQIKADPKSSHLLYTTYFLLFTQTAPMTNEEQALHVSRWYEMNSKKWSGSGLDFAYIVCAYHTGSGQPLPNASVNFPNRRCFV